MTITAAEILSHCKAVVNGEIPQPELLRLEADDFHCRIFYKDSPHAVWGFNSDSNEGYLQVAARLLNLDRPSPAPVVLEWDTLGEYEYAAYFGHENCVSAYIKHEGLGNRFRAEIRVFTQLVKIKYFKEVEVDQARAWCVAEITKIITPTPRT